MRCSCVRPKASNKWTQWRDLPKSKPPVFIGGVTDFTYSVQPPKHANRAAMYRAVLQHLRLLPDPVIWLQYAPMMRALCRSHRTSTGEDAEAAPAEAKGDDEVDWADMDEKARREVQEDLKRRKTLKQAREILTDIRGAVACHPHVLRRVLQTAYNQTGRNRWTALRKVQATSVPSDEVRPNEHHLANREPVPKPLFPLLKQNPNNLPNMAPPITMGNETGPQMDGRAKGQTQRQSRMQWAKMFSSVPVPLRFPEGTGVRTGLENTGMIETMQAFAQVGEAYRTMLDTEPRTVPAHVADLAPIHNQYNLPDFYQLPSFDKLPPVLRLIFPKHLTPTMRETPLPRPPRHETKANPRTWHHPVHLTPRLLTRSYQHLWNSLRWTRPETSDQNGKWVECGYEDVVYWEQGRFAEMDTPATFAKKRALRDGPGEWSGIEDCSQIETRWVKKAAQTRSMKATVDRLLNK